MYHKIEKIKEMYKISGYNKQFIILFSIIIFATIMEIITVPFIIKKIINVHIPNGNIKLLVLWGIIYIIFLIISCSLTLKHCNMRSILKIKIKSDLREKIFNKMRRNKD